MNARRWILSGSALLGLYGLFCLFLYLAQDFLIFDPRPLPAQYSFREGEEVEVAVAEGIDLNCLWLKEKGPARGVVLYFHGNRGSNRRCLRQAKTMAGHGYDIFMPDYRGYGKSGGHIQSERQLYEDAQKIYAFLRTHYREEQIVIVGYSLGSGMASYLAAHHQPAHLVLLAPFLSIIDLKDRRIPFVPDALVKYPLDNYAHLSQANCPVTLFHGTRDDIIPFESSEILQALQRDRFQLVKAQDEGHRGIIFSSVFREGMRSVLTQLGSRG